MIFVNVRNGLHDIMHFTIVMKYRYIKILLLLILVCTAVSCTTGIKPASVIEEDKLYMTRIYVGNFLDSQYTKSDPYGNPDLIWITTSQDTLYGKISVYGKECLFTPGERLYLRRILSVNRKSEAWVYQIENSTTASYLVYEYQVHNKGLVESWMKANPGEQLKP
jgi:hypothetical protein